MEQQFTSAEVARLSGISLRQLQWWDEQGIVVPERDGRRRLYSFDDVTELAVICALRRKGFPLQRMRPVVRFLEKEFGGRLAESVSSGPEYHLLIDGRHIYVENSPRQVIEILKNARQPLLDVCLSDTAREVRYEIFKRRSGRSWSERARQASSRDKLIQRITQSAKRRRIA
ncbi:MAG TPA: MerR family transcriptional regulator [Candidatus Angelobacter sp.]|nr:MerR family transcriptional regulator [Candidatus Angelobacter sp.]